ncbi:MAG: glycosyl transferase, partial [Chitinophagaceae bacterium]|nr:glycosyl transferase [Chitinophagaceae bacterium]
MKILYSVQATGNGHISRAMELLPFLEKYGQVDLFLSGANSSLALNAPIKYRSKGLSLFYTCTGSLDMTKTFRNASPYRI